MFFPFGPFTAPWSSQFPLPPWMMSSWDAEVPSSLEAHTAPSTLCSPHRKFLASRDSGQEPWGGKVCWTFPTTVALLRMWLLLPWSPELPISTTTTCMASVLGVRAYGGLTALCPQVPFPTMVALLCMWFGISLPLVYLGYYFGFRKQPYDNPVRTNQIPRQIPEQRWYMNRFVG